MGIALMLYYVKRWGFILNIEVSYYLYIKTT